MRVFLQTNVLRFHTVTAMAALKFGLQRFAALAMHAHQRWAGITGQVFVAPLGQVGNHRVEVAAHGGQPVFVAQGPFLVGRFFQYPAIGQLAPDGCRGIHLNMPIGRPGPGDMESKDPKVLKALQRLGFYQQWDSGYSKQQSTRPQTIGYALVDSPVGLAAWMLEKVYFWTDNDGSPWDVLSMDQVIDDIMLYWLPATGASAARLYWESFGSFGEGIVAISAGASAFPGEILPAPREWAERTLTKLVYWNEVERGGHFAAWEQPELFVQELRACFAKMV